MRILIFLIISILSSSNAISASKSRPTKEEGAEEVGVPFETRLTAEDAFEEGGIEEDDDTEQVESQNSKYPTLLSNLPPEIIEDFDNEILERVRFWINIFGHYSTTQAVIHDAKYVDIVYDVVDLSDIYNKENENSYVKQRKASKKVRGVQKKYRELLRSVHKKQKNPSSLNDEEFRIYNLLKHLPGKNKFIHASKKNRVRGQLGLRDRTLNGMKVAGRYIKEMETIFKELGLPKILTRLPYVESSFNLMARSKVGASGIWQFMPGSGKFYRLKINNAVDERNDPITATKAAAKMLKRNYEELESWPLSLTAYNFGLGNVKRAIRKVKSTRLSKIIQVYKGKRFGFASSNFYASFLAAVIVDRDRIKYFGHFTPDPPFQYESIEIPGFILLSDLCKEAQIVQELIIDYNPALSPSVKRLESYIPKGFQLKIPTQDLERVKEKIAHLSKETLHAQQIRPTTHRVARGQTLSQIAEKYRVKLSKILDHNGLTKKSVIFPGQQIKIPRQ